MPRTKTRKLSDDERRMIDELDLWCGGDPRRVNFVKQQMEFFDLNSIVLIVRALHETGIAKVK